MSYKVPEASWPLEWFVCLRREHNVKHLARKLSSFTFLYFLTTSHTPCYLVTKLQIQFHPNGWCCLIQNDIMADWLRNKILQFQEMRQEQDYYCKLLLCCPVVDRGRGDLVFAEVKTFPGWFIDHFHRGLTDAFQVHLVPMSIYQRTLSGLIWIKSPEHGLHWPPFSRPSSSGVKVIHWITWGCCLLLGCI